MSAAAPDLASVVDRTASWLAGVYALDLDFDAGDFVVSPRVARRMLPPGSPRTGVLVVQEEDSLSLGLYVDPRDRRRTAAIVEETSHLVCIGWHAARDLQVSALALELQAEVDCFVFGSFRGGDPLAHFSSFRWADWLDAPARRRYRTAHRRAERYCRRLARTFPQRADRPALLAELRRFYRVSPSDKLRLSAA